MRVSWWEFTLLVLVVAVVARLILWTWERLTREEGLPPINILTCPKCGWTETKRTIVRETKELRVTECKCLMCDQEFTVRLYTSGARETENGIDEVMED